MSFSSGVYPCSDIEIKVGATSATTYVVADMETVSITFDANIEQWKPFDQEGWARALKTGDGLTLSFTGKRNVGDNGNDFIANMLGKMGQDSEAYITVKFPNNYTITMNNAVISVKDMGGSTTDVAPLNWEAISNGKPTFTPPAVAGGGGGST